MQKGRDGGSTANGTDDVERGLGGTLETNAAAYMTNVASFTRTFDDELATVEQRQASLGSRRWVFISLSRCLVVSLARVIACAYPRAHSFVRPFGRSVVRSFGRSVDPQGEQHV